jgi:hypothetical protein
MSTNMRTAWLAITLSVSVLCLGCVIEDDRAAVASSESATEAVKTAEGRGLETPEKGSGATWPSRAAMRKKTPKRGMDTLSKPPPQETPTVSRADGEQPTQQPGAGEAKR